MGRGNGSYEVSRCARLHGVVRCCKPLVFLWGPQSLRTEKEGVTRLHSVVTTLTDSDYMGNQTIMDKIR
jgi:hypothetical protein